MYMYSGTVTAKPGQHAQLGDYLVKLRDAALRLGLPASAWSAIGGAPLGTFGLSYRVSGLDEIVHYTMTLEADDEWVQLLRESGEHCNAPADVSHRQLVDGTSSDFGGHPMLSIHDAVIRNGSLKQGLAAGSTLLHRVHDICGIDGVLMISDAGQGNRMSLVFGVESAAAGDAANAAIAADPTWADQVDGVAGVFVDGASERMYLMRLP